MCRGSLTIGQVVIASSERKFVSAQCWLCCCKSGMEAELMHAMALSLVNFAFDVYMDIAPYLHDSIINCMFWKKRISVSVAALRYISLKTITVIVVVVVTWRVNPMGTHHALNERTKKFRGSGVEPRPNLCYIFKVFAIPSRLQHVHTRVPALRI